MANLAIKGHSKRNKEVIEILEMLGGYKPECLKFDSDFYYYINKFNNIECSNKPYKYEKHIIWQ